jgi:hypothetical protein
VVAHNDDERFFVKIQLFQFIEEFSEVSVRKRELESIAEASEFGDLRISAPEFAKFAQSPEGMERGSIIRDVGGAILKVAPGDVGKSEVLEESGGAICIGGIGGAGDAIEEVLHLQCAFRVPVETEFPDVPESHLIVVVSDAEPTGR